MNATPDLVLSVEDLECGYGRLTVLREVSLAVERGSVVAVLGANGAGKSTLLRAVVGLLVPTSGTILFDSVDVTGWPAHRIARRGMCLIPDGRGIYASLSVRDNLELYVPAGRSVDAPGIIAHLFPALGDRMRQIAGTLSGGEQQMLALSRAYLASPKLVLIDELSMGLAPLVIDQLFDSLRTLSERGVALLIVEQYVARAIELADEVYVLANGRVTLHGPAEEMNEERLAAHYLTGGVRS